jgi:indolepyruvate ferredoxin oxidoreductase, beta subunit
MNPDPTTVQTKEAIFNVYLVGVGGQGILTIGEILASAAEARGLPVNFFPSKGMAQRGGFVKAQLRLGRETVGPNIPEGGADLVVAMERSEALKAIPFVKAGGVFILLGEVWSPADVTLGKAAYPALDAVRAAVEAAGARLVYLDPGALPSFQGEPVPANSFVLGVALRETALGNLFEAAEIERVLGERFKRAVEVNRFALRAGLG